MSIRAGLTTGCTNTVCKVDPTVGVGRASFGDVIAACSSTAIAPLTSLLYVTAPTRTI